MSSYFDFLLQFFGFGLFLPRLSVTVAFVTVCPSDPVDEVLHLVPTFVIVKHKTET